MEIEHLKMKIEIKNLKEDLRKVKHENEYLWSLLRRH